MANSDTCTHGIRLDVPCAACKQAREADVSGYDAGTSERVTKDAAAAARALGARFEITAGGIAAMYGVDATSLQEAMLQALWRRVAALERQVAELQGTKALNLFDDAAGEDARPITRHVSQPTTGRPESRR